MAGPVPATHALLVEWPQARRGCSGPRRPMPSRNCHRSKIYRSKVNNGQGRNRHESSREHVLRGRDCRRCRGVRRRAAIGRRYHGGVGERDAAAGARTQTGRRRSEDHGAARPRFREKQLRRPPALSRQCAERQEAHRRGAHPQHDGLWTKASHHGPASS
jgi:hypothetical protein